MPRKLLLSGIPTDHFISLSLASGCLIRYATSKWVSTPQSQSPINLIFRFQAFGGKWWGGLFLISRNSGEKVRQISFMQTKMFWVAKEGIKKVRKKIAEKLGQRARAAGVKQRACNCGG